MKPENAFVTVQEGTLCLAIVVMTKQQPVSILGNLAQQNIHVGSPPQTAQGAASQRSILAAGRRAVGEEDGADGEQDRKSEDAAAVVVHLHRSRARAVSGVAGGSRRVERAGTASSRVGAVGHLSGSPFSSVPTAAVSLLPCRRPRRRLPGLSDGPTPRSHTPLQPPDLLPTRQLPCWLLQREEK
uniref:Uncharacterized protein n=1 Tax=Oryza glumipatula TaxID=40148 RepID=A0A0E0AIY4_9ORYZ